MLRWREAERVIGRCDVCGPVYMQLVDILGVDLSRQVLEYIYHKSVEKHSVTTEFDGIEYLENHVLWFYFHVLEIKHDRYEIHPSSQRTFSLVYSGEDN